MPAFIALMIIMILNSPYAKATPNIEIISQTDHLEFGQTQTAYINITANSTIIQAIIEVDQQNHTLQKENGYYKYTWLPQSTGIHYYGIYATDSQNETQIMSSSFTVIDTTPPEIIETQPAGDLNYNLIELKAITNENSACKYDEADLNYDSMNFALSGEGAQHTKLRSFGDGNTLLYVKCKDSYNNVGTSRIINFTIDTTPPAISGLAPMLTVNQEPITLKITTDETATCKWGKTSQAYDNLENQFITTHTTYHEQTLSLNEGINSYFISCKDNIGNKNPTVSINIDLNLPPTASISIEKNNSYKTINQGTYKISLTSSEPLAQAPNLKLRYANQIINVPVEGSSQYWTGYLIIPIDIGEEVGEFIYSGLDTKGTTGTEITSGKLVLIDTLPPLTPTALKLTNENNKIRISWNYEGEDIDHYNIYRSTTGKTDKSNFKTTTQENVYSDADVTNKIGYFYRVSAVDKAGNEGPLSDEEFIMAEFQNASTQFRQDADLLTTINNRINELEKIVQDIDLRVANWEAITDANLLQLINDEKIIDDQKEVKSKIQTLIGELKTYRETKLTEKDLEAKDSIITAKLDEYKKGIIKEMRVINKIQKEQIPDPAVVQEVITEYLKDKSLSDAQRKTYALKTKELGNQVRISQEIISYQIEYEYQQSKTLTIVKETFLSIDSLKETIIQETIPKEVLSISEITFMQMPKEINRLGVIWESKSIENNEIRYKTTVPKDLNQMQRIKTVLVYDVEAFLKSTSEGDQNGSNQFTGAVVSENKQGFSLVTLVLVSIAGILVIALLIYYLGFLKSGSKYEQDVFRELDKDEQELRKLIVMGEAPDSSYQTDLDQIFLLVQQAYQELTHGNVGEVYQTYALILEQYNNSRLSFKDRLKANLEINKLRECVLAAIKPKDLYT